MNSGTPSENRSTGSRPPKPATTLNTPVIKQNVIENALTHEQIGPQELGTLDTDAFDGPVFDGSEDLRAFLGDEERVGTQGGAHAHLPRDGLVIFEQLFGLRSEFLFHGGASGDVPLGGELPFVLG